MNTSSLGCVNRNIIIGARSLTSCGFRRGGGSNGNGKAIDEQRQCFHIHIRRSLGRRGARRCRTTVGSEGPSSSWQSGHHARLCHLFQLQGLVGGGNDDRRTQIDHELYNINGASISLGHSQFSWGGMQCNSIRPFANFQLPSGVRIRSDSPVRYFSSHISNRHMNMNVSRITATSFFNECSGRRWPTCIDMDQLFGGKARYHTKRQHQPLQHPEPHHHHHQQQQPTPLPSPSITKMLSILVPESKSLLLAFGALTISTVATMQIPNAIGQIIDLLSTSATVMIPVDDATFATSGIIDSVHNLDSPHPPPPPSLSSPTQLSFPSSELISNNDDSTITSLTPQQLKHQVLQQEMESIGLQLMSYFTVGAVATFAHSTLFDTVGQKISANLRKKLFGTLIHRDISFFDKNKAGELANRLSTDVHEVAEHLVQNFAYYLSNLVRSIIAIVQMILISPLLTATMVPLPILLGGMASFYGKFIRRWSAQHLDVLAHSTHVASERFSGISTVLSFGQRHSELQRYSGVIDAAFGYARRVAVFQGAFMGSSYLVGNGALLGVLIVGAIQVFEGNMTAGSLVGFCLYAGHLSESVIELSTATGGILQAQGSGARLFALLEKDGEHSFLDPDTDEVNTFRTAATTLPALYNPTIRFEEVEFAYPAHPHMPVLNNLSFTLRCGEMLALTGLSGSGKSSIVSLLMRFYEPKSGRITLDGVDIRDLDIDWLRSQFGLVGQEPILFHASVFENVAYGKPHSTHDEVIEACIAAGAHRLIL